MEDFMEIDAALAERDEVAAKVERPSSALRGGTNALDEVNNVPDLLSLHRDYLGGCAEPVVGRRSSLRTVD